MTTYSDKKQACLAYVSLCGSHHKKKHERNQDACFVRLSHAYSVFCVADGVGSHKYSRKGSRAIARAVDDVFADFIAGKVDRKKISVTIYKRFQTKIRKKYRDRASTTCIFVAITKEHGVFVGQVGDGLAVVRINGELKYVSDKEDDFSNLVVPLSPLKENHRWTTRHYDASENDEIEIFLSTDGVSGDVINGREEECLDYFLRKISEDRKSGNKTLKKILKDWGKDGSNDDKTVIIYKSR